MGFHIERFLRWLSSPFLVNLFVYQGFINELSQCASGININNASLNVVCYADDLVLANIARRMMMMMMIDVLRPPLYTW